MLDHQFVFVRICCFHDASQWLLHLLIAALCHLKRPPYTEPPLWFEPMKLWSSGRLWLGLDDQSTRMEYNMMELYIYIKYTLDYDGTWFHSIYLPWYTYFDLYIIVYNLYVSLGGQEQNLCPAWSANPEDHPKSPRVGGQIKIKGKWAMKSTFGRKGNIPQELPQFTRVSVVSANLFHPTQFP